MKPSDSDSDSDEEEEEEEEEMICRTFDTSMKVWDLNE